MPGSLDELNERQREITDFAILSLQKHIGDVDFQVSAFSRYSSLFFSPDLLGDLLFNGIAQQASRQDWASGVQSDASWRVNEQHTIRAGFIAQGERTGSNTLSQVLPVDPNTGRILTVVNQKIAFGDGYIPCSTIKPTIALAALEENVITRDTMLKVGRRKYMNLTEAMAHSNNVFFEQLGSRMGFETVSKYGRLLGLGELAGYNLPDEHPGSFPTKPPAYGGVARMSSFGEGIQVTPLQLAALSAAFANGGTLYYLQYPHSQEEVENFTPRVKRELNIALILPEIREGLLAAVLYGTGKSSFDRGGDEMPLGKTGTCDDHTTPSKIGWFLTYADDAHPKIALAVLLRGNTRRVKGPTAAVVAGRIYRKLREQNYFADSGHAVAVNTGN